MNQAIEVVIFRAKSGITDKQVEAAAYAVTGILKEMSGFISRDFGASEDGQYIDVVHWQDLYAAETAAEKAMNNAICVDFFNLIDREQMQFMHFTKMV